MGFKLLYKWLGKGYFQCKKERRHSRDELLTALVVVRGGINQPEVVCV